MLAPKGEIRHLAVPWLFQEIISSKKSGTAVFEQSKLTKKVYFGNGDILFASSNVDDDGLAEFLLRQGRINQAQFDASSEIVIKTRKKLGAVLIELGLLSPKDLVVQVKLQVKQIILGLFAWRDGQYSFKEGVLPADEIIPLQMSAADLVLEGVQALDWQFIRKTLPPMKTVLQAASGSDPSPIFPHANLSADQKTVLSLIDGARTIEEICSLTGMGDFNTLKSIYLLLALRMAAAGEQKEPPARAAADELAKTGGKKPGEPEAPTTRQMIQEAFDAMKQQDDFQVLGVNNTMSAEELRKVYLKLAKRYHPDRHFETEMADMKEKLEALFSRIHDAYQNISGSVRNQKYEEAPAGKESPVHFEEKRAEDYVENYSEKSARAVSYFNSGMKDFHAGNFWGATEYFASATRLDPVTARYFYYYGMALMRIPRRRHEAEENLQKAIEIDPLKPEYYLELGNLYLKSGLKTKAIDVFISALRDNPNSGKITEAIQAAGGEVPKGNDDAGDGLFKKMFKDRK